MNAIASATVALTFLAQQPSLDREFDVALGAAGLSTKGAMLDGPISAFYRQGDHETTLFRSLYRDPWRTPFVMDMTKRQISANTGNPGATLEAMGRAVGNGARRTLLGDPNAERVRSASQDSALDRVLARYKDAGLIRGAIPSTSGVPKETQRAAALVLATVQDSIGFRRATFRNADPAQVYKEETGELLDETDPEAYRRYAAFLGAIDSSYLRAAAQDVTMAVTRAEADARLVLPSVTYRFQVETDWGRIVLCGGGSDTHSGEATLLLIDTSGDDTYVNQPANLSPGNWCSIAIDTAGKDAYLSDPALAKVTVADFSARGAARTACGPVSALCGVSVLVDSIGDDLYRSHRPGVASARNGVAVLLDKAGNDTYEAYSDGIALARNGLALVEDLAGDDRYLGLTNVQGVGLTKGFGLLLDRSGNDEYTANDTVLDFPSAQSAEHNTSMAQGAGYGLRGDYVSGNSLAGGIGMLLDLAGNDTYSAAVFGQGVGYWEGVGALIDESGTDRYSGLWYVQGASAHFAIGYCEDAIGNDKYVATMNMAQGAGHDFGFGMLIERDGDDNYEGPGLALGAGNDNGIGVFVDTSGSDTYAARGISMGSAAESQKSSLREHALCLGLFIDLAGRDTYPPALSWATNGARTANWNSQQPRPEDSQVGVFWDRD